MEPLALERAMVSFTPHVSSIPAAIDLVDECEYMSPHCDTPLYAGATPLALNLTLLDSTRPDAEIVGEPSWRLTDSGSGPDAAKWLRVSFAYERRFRAWANFVGVAFQVRADAPAGLSAVVSGQIEVQVADGAQRGGEALRAQRHTSLSHRRVVVPVRLRLQPAPPRSSLVPLRLRVPRAGPGR